MPLNPSEQPTPDPGTGQTPGGSQDDNGSSWKPGDGKVLIIAAVLAVVIFVLAMVFGR